MECRHAKIFRCSLSSGPKVNLNERSLILYEHFLLLFYCFFFAIHAGSRTCEEPASSGPHVWPDDIAEWPVRNVHQCFHRHRRFFLRFFCQTIQFSHCVYMLEEGFRNTALEYPHQKYFINTTILLSIP